MYVHSESVSVRLLFAAFVSLAAGSALADRPNSLANSPANSLADSLAELRAVTAPHSADRSRGKLTASLRAAYVQSQQKQAGAAYGVVTKGAQVVASNALHHLGLALDAQGVHLQGSDGAGLGSLRLLRAGCGERPVLLDAVAPRGQGTRVEYQRPGLTEWYANGPMGLEQGFTLTAAAACPRLGLELQLGGAWAARLVGSGDQARIELDDGKGGQRVYYSDLFARDAQGQELPTKLLLDGQTIRLEVDTSAAHYPVEVDPLMWTQQQLTTSDGATQDTDGYAVAVSGNTALVSAPGKDLGNGYLQGQVYVYVRSGNTWTEQQKLVASDGATQDVLGFAVALSGDTAIVTAPRRKVEGNNYQGQAYVYVRSGTTWTEQQILTSSDGAAQDQFGYRVAMTSDTAVISAPVKMVGANSSQGQLYVFTKTGATWTEQQILTAADGAQSDSLGQSLAISGDTIVAGNFQKTVGANGSQGEVNIFTRAGTTWTEQTPVVSTDGAQGDLFGYGVAVSGNTIAVGAIGRMVGANASQGQIYVFTQNGNTWTEQQKLVASDGAAGDTLGFSLALSDNTLAVGTYAKAVNMKPAQGQAYVFTRSGTTWTEQQIYTSTSGAMPAYFGYTLALDGTTLVVGAPIETVNTNGGQGTAYVIFLPGSPNGAQCAVATDCQSAFCTDGVCCASACGSSNKSDCQSCAAAESGGVDGVCAPIAERLKTTCRAAAGVCDSAELCDGTSAVCPSDKLLAAGTVCQAAPDASLRDALCSGTSVSCAAPLPAYQFSGGGVSGCAAALPASAAPRAAGAAWALTALFLLVATRRRTRRDQV